MTRRALLLLLVVAGCGAGDGAVLVTVDSAAPVRGVDHFHLTVQMNGSPATKDLALTGRPVDLPPPRTFSMVFDKDHTGPFTLTVEAMDAAGNKLSSGTATGDVEASQNSAMTVHLGGGTGADGGVMADLVGADLAGADLTGAPPDLAPPPPDLKMPPVLNFTNAGNVAVAANPQGIARGDLNGDGYIDVATASYQSGSVSVLLNDGTGKLSLAGNFPAGGNGQDVEMADFNKDGKLDVVTATVQQNVYVLYGNGTGALGTAGPIALSGVYATSAVAGDLNNDNIPDIAVAAVNNSTGSKVAAIVNKPAGSYQTPTYQPAGAQPRSIRLGDFNKDGKLDAVETNSSSGTIAVYLGNGDGTFAAPSTFGTTGANPNWTAVADFNKDGNLDVAVSSDAGLELFTGKGDGTFTGPSVSPAGSSPYGARTLDLDNDGNLDVVVANYIQAGGVSVLLGDGAGHFAQPKFFPTGANPLHLILADLNGDGLPEIVVANAGDNNVTVLVNTTK